MRPFERGALVLGLVAMCGGAGAAEAPATPIKLDIRVQPIGDALNEFARQSGLQVVIDPQEGGNIKAPRVVGMYTPDAALTKLLADTGLRYEYLNERTVAVRTAKAEAPPKNTSDARKENPRPLVVARAPNESPQTTTAVEQNARDGSDSEASAGQRVVLPQVVVTGSHIRGDVPAGSRVITITSEDIEKSGHAQLEDFFEHLPQNFSGSASEDSTTTAMNYNANGGTTIDLRGLGGGTTLILVNGHRQPAGDTRGTFTDISSIPSSAVERIEILTDGASAIYGSDAIGGVVNFILRKDYEGAETKVRFGSLDGKADELQFSQLFGTSWSGGHALFGYQYLQRDPLDAQDIAYSAAQGDMRRFGGSDFRTIYTPGVPGIILDPDYNPAFGIPVGQDGSSLTPGNLTALNGVLPAGYPSGQGERWAMHEEKLHTFFVNASQRMTDNVELFVEGRYGKRDVKNLNGGAVGVFAVPSTNPFYVNPFGGTDDVLVAYNFAADGLLAVEAGEVDTHAETVGVTARLNDWQVTVSGSYGTEKNAYGRRNEYYEDAVYAALSGTTPSTALNLFGNGSNDAALIDSIRTGDQLHSTSEVWSGGVVADGPLVRLFGREVRLAVGADYRNESMESFQLYYPEFTPYIQQFTQSRHVKAAFGELAIPLLRPEAGTQRLELSLAARYEEYSDFGTTLNPKVGLRWQPLEALQLRGTWGTSFRAPKLVEMTPGFSSNEIYLFERSVVNPLVPGEFWNALTLGGPDPGLHEETADVWTAGFDFAPRSLEGFNLSLSYFNIDYQDKIEYVGLFHILYQGPQSFYAYKDFYAAAPSPALIDSVCTQFPGDCTGAPVDLVAYVGLHNLSKVTVRGVDFDISQSLKFAAGTLGFGVGGTRMADYDKTVVSGTDPLPLVNTVGNPLQLRLRGKVSWDRGNWGATLYINHAGSYDNPGGAPSKMGALTTADFNLSYRIDAARGWFSDSRFSLSVVNVLDDLPPFLDSESGYDTANGDVLGRKMNLMFTKQW